MDGEGTGEKRRESNNEDKSSHQRRSAVPICQRLGRPYQMFPQVCYRSIWQAICHLRDCIASSSQEEQAEERLLLCDAVRACVADRTSSMMHENDEVPAT